VSTGVGTDRRRHVLGKVAEMVENEGLHAGVRQVCLDCTTRTRTIGAAVYLTTGRGTASPFETTGPLAEEIAELQTVLEEGPASAAIRENWPVLVPHLAQSTTRWPLFAPAALAAGVTAVFAVPLTLGAGSLGTVEVHRDTGSALEPGELADVVLLAEVVTTLLLDLSAGAATTTSER